VEQACEAVQDEDTDAKAPMKVHTNVFEEQRQAEMGVGFDPAPEGELCGRQRTALEQPSRGCSRERPRAVADS
jgi:hypothetical protein